MDTEWSGRRPGLWEPSFLSLGVFPLAGEADLRSDSLHPRPTDSLAQPPVGFPTFPAAAPDPPGGSSPTMAVVVSYSS